MWDENTVKVCMFYVKKDFWFCQHIKLNFDMAMFFKNESNHKLHDTKVKFYFT